MKILKQIRNRYSPRKFSDKEIKKEKINKILEAARWAPSGFNKQPWRYIVVKKNSEYFNKVVKTLMPGNGWAKTAPLFIIAYSNPKLQRSGNNIPYHIYETGLSVMSLCIEAEHQGLKTHQMGGFFGKKLHKTLGLNKNDEVIVVIAVGYEDKKLGTTQKITKGVVNTLIKPRERKEIDEFTSYK